MHSTRPNRSGLIAGTAALTVLLVTSGCSRKYDVAQRLTCDSSEVAGSAELWGDRLFVQARENVRWDQLIVVPEVDWYNDPPKTFEGLEARFGTPLESSNEQGLLSVRYQLNEGMLQLSERAERSGSAVHRAWVLTLTPGSPMHPSRVLEESTFNCAKDLIPLARSLYLISDSNHTHLVLGIENGLVREWVW